MDWIIIILVILVVVAWFAWNYYSIRRAAHFIDNADFASRIHTSQVIDIREATSFKAKHIMGARNLPASQIDLSLSAIRKDKPVLLYAESRSTALPRVIRTLKRAGFIDLYVLNDGFDYWTGKVKEG